MVVCVWVLGSGGKVGFFLMGAANHHRYQYSISLQVCVVFVVFMYPGIITCETEVKQAAVLQTMCVGVLVVVWH